MNDLCKRNTAERPEDSNRMITFEGPWEDVTRKLFPDLTGTDDGYVIAVAAPGYGVLVGCSADPAYYLLTKGKRYKTQSVNFCTALVSKPIKASHAFARALFYELTGQRRMYASLVNLSLKDVRETIESRLKARRPA